MRKMKIKFCPKCKNTDLIMVAGGNIGILECKKCRFRGSIFPEREIKIKKRRRKKK